MSELEHMIYLIVGLGGAWLLFYLWLRLTLPTSVQNRIKDWWDGKE